MTGPVPPAALAAARAAAPFVNRHAVRRILEAGAPAIAAAERAKWIRIEPDPDSPSHNQGVFDVSALVAEAVAAERERCAQLAEEHGAHYGCYVSIGDTVTSGLRPAAALLRDQPPATEGTT